MVKNQKYQELAFRSVEESEIDFIHKMQNGQCTEDIAWFFDSDNIWLPMSRKEIADKIQNIQKEDNQYIFAVWKGEDFVGLGAFYNNWDPWCPGISLIIWPEFRRQGIGTELAENLMDKVFNQYHGNMISEGTADYNEAGQSFMKRLGMKPCGRIRRVAVRDGKFVDAVCFDLLKSEYLTDRKRKGVRRRRN